MVCQWKGVQYYNYTIASPKLPKEILSLSARVDN